MKVNRRYVYSLVHRIVSKVQSKVDSTIPKFDLQKKHLANVKLLPNRTVLLESLPKNGFIAELGVNRGEFSQQIMQICNPSELHLVDAWSSERYHSGLKDGVESVFRKELDLGKVFIHQGYSTVMAVGFEDRFFDWIYIDTDHSYSVTKAELYAYRNKIKPGGIIAGHDYIQGNWPKLLRYGVVEAVHEFCVDEDWELLYLTTELTNSPSFAIRKIIS
ncbi:class I SAM-dependent methyltransferase [Algoriphagus aestuariicola]|uniref:Class I SAM-dependent methyltransferase n=1 Tax=Algoriphagus aestuariicola TaxID=1852016 RepID=A0ABS3BPC1_9BACT|nr:class I SAM-dependent methyltransferase [Algoriphagus aestuariicola]MBN7800175.1 class I SAM-dependent methyltransferase [Algoriphagus aestuariicola]